MNEKAVCEENECTGCGVCQAVCQQNAINVADYLDHIQATIDINKCVNCNMCADVCPSINSIEFLTPQLWKQGWAVDEYRECGSSGGIASAIVDAALQNGYKAFSCIFDNGAFSIVEITKKDLDKISGSKYVKSIVREDSYYQIREYLNAGNKVLLIALPCQCAAVKRFIGHAKEQLLYTVDLICHGTPSVNLLKKFLSEEKKSIQSVKQISFREKNYFSISVDGHYLMDRRLMDRYTIAFLNRLIYTENCYLCRYARPERCTDLTLGDSWGTNLSKAEIKNGISLLLCQTSKGEELLKLPRVHLEAVNLENAVNNNMQLQKPAEKPVTRGTFFAEIEKKVSFKKAVKHAYKKICIRQDLKFLLIKLHLYKRAI